MNNNVKIARELVRIAKELTAANAKPISKFEDSLVNVWNWTCELQNDRQNGIDDCMVYLTFEHPGKYDNSVKQDEDVIHGWFNYTFTEDYGYNFEEKTNLELDESARSGEPFGSKITINLLAQNLVDTPDGHEVFKVLRQSRSKLFAGD